MKCCIKCQLLRRLIASNFLGLMRQSTMVISSNQRMKYQILVAGAVCVACDRRKQVLLANLVIVVDFTLQIKSMLLSALTSDTMNLETFQPRNISPNVGIPMPEKSCSSAFTTSLQLVISIPAISQTSMRSAKDNRQQLQLSHIRLPLYIVSLEQCIIS